MALFGHCHRNTKYLTWLVFDLVRLLRVNANEVKDRRQKTDRSETVISKNIVP